MPQRFWLKSLLVVLLCSFGHMHAADTVPMVISIPKAGTHLLLKLSQMMLPGKKTVYSSKYNEKEFPELNPYMYLNENSILNAIDTEGPLLGAHLDYWVEENRELIEKYHVQGVFIFRDFRDQVVSEAFWFKKKIVQLADVPLDDLMTYLISNRNYLGVFTRGLDPEALGDSQTCYDYYQTFLPWINHPNIYAVRFEDLIGPKGGGSKKKQLIVIKNISSHFGIHLSQEQVCDLADRLFGKSYTFRKGQIGDWKNHFTEEHKALFKEVAGDLLIEYGYEEDFDW